MTLTQIRRIQRALAAMIVACALLTGCASKSVKVKVTPIPRADADDIVQIIGTTISADNGGWYLVIKRLADSLSVPAPNVTAGTPRLFTVSPLSAMPGVRNTFQIIGGSGPIVYNLDVGYLGGNQTIATNRDTSASDMLVNVTCVASPFINANGVNPGTYWMTARDSAMIVSNLQVTAPDTLEFSGSLEDSCLALVYSSISSATVGRYWFVQNFVDFRLRLLKSNLTTQPYPVGPDSEIQWNIEAFALRGSNPRDWAYDDFVEIRMQFDGSPDAVLTIADVLPDPNWAYYYKLNLNTGLIARLN